MKWMSHLYVKDRYILAEQVQTKSLVVFWDYLTLMLHTAKKTEEDSKFNIYLINFPSLSVSCTEGVWKIH